MSRHTFVIEGFTPGWKAHSGGTLKEVMLEFGMTQVEMAAACGVSQKHISEIVNGKAGIGPVLALALERITHVSADFWARLQAQYDVADARQRVTAAIATEEGAEPLVIEGYVNPDGSGLGNRSRVVPSSEEEV